MRGNLSNTHSPSWIASRLLIRIRIIRYILYLDHVYAKLLHVARSTTNVSLETSYEIFKYCTFLSSYPYGWFHGIFHLQFFAFRIEASASPLPQSLACHLLIPRLITALLWFLKLKIEEIYVIDIEPKYSHISVHH